MKTNLLLFVTLFFQLTSAQNPKIDSLLQELKKHPEKNSYEQADSVRANVLVDLAMEYYRTADKEKALALSREALTISEKLNFKRGQSEALNIFGVVYAAQGNLPEALKNYKASLKIREEIGYKKGVAGSLNNIGTIYKKQGIHAEAIKYFFSALKINEELGNKKWMVINYNNIGNIYEQQGNIDEAIKEQLAALKLSEEIGDKRGIANSHNNLGGIYARKQEFAKALTHFEKSKEIDEELGDKIYVADAYNNTGNAYSDMQNYSAAFENFKKGLKLSEETGYRAGIATNYVNMGTALLKMKKPAEARGWLLKGVALSMEINILDLTKEGYGNLAKADSAAGDYKSALEHQKLYILYRDSIISEQNTKKITQQQMQFEFDKKEAVSKAEQEKKDAIAQKELQRQKLVRNGFIGGFAVVLLFAGVFFTQRNKIKAGKKRSDELLLNILPEEVAEELKAKGSADAKQFDDVTVLFTDFKNFTQISEKLSPTELVNEIHTCFKAFDHIIEKHNIEKIKTIGDSYMCAGGLPVANKTHADDVVRAAVEIQKFMLEHLQQRKSEEKEPFEIRIGIHTGPVVAGIVGVKKFAYDIWGDTVNIASRMESSGEAGKVNISGSTYELVKNKFTCIHRGKIQAKNKGEIDMYFVE